MHPSSDLMTKNLEVSLDSDLLMHRMTQLEHQVQQLLETTTQMQDQYLNLTQHIRETQRYLIKLAQTHHQLSKRVSQWPYLTISSEDNET